MFMPITQQLLPVGDLTLGRDSRNQNAPPHSSPCRGLCRSAGAVPSLEPSNRHPNKHTLTMAWLSLHSPCGLIRCRLRGRSTLASMLSRPAYFMPAQTGSLCMRSWVWAGIETRRTRYATENKPIGIQRGCPERYLPNFNTIVCPRDRTGYDDKRWRRPRSFPSRAPQRSRTQNPAQQRRRL